MLKYPSLISVEEAGQVLGRPIVSKLCKNVYAVNKDIFD